MRRIYNKRAFAEVFSWVSALMIIFLIAGISLTIYKIIGNKAGTDSERFTGSSWENLENLRATEMFIGEPVVEEDKSSSFGVVSYNLWEYRGEDNFLQIYPGLFSKFRKSYDLDSERSRIAIGTDPKQTIPQCALRTDPKSPFTDFNNPNSIVSSFLYSGEKMGYVYNVVYVLQKKDSFIPFLVWAKAESCVKVLGGNH